MKKTVGLKSHLKMNSIKQCISKEKTIKTLIALNHTVFTYLFVVKNIYIGMAYFVKC